MVEAEDQVTPEGDQDPKASGSLGWRAGLSDEHKEDPWAKEHDAVSKFFPAALAIRAERDDLQSKLKGAIFKPGEKATDEEVAAYRKGMNIPDTPEGYEFPIAEGVKHDPAMVSWAQNIFHGAGLSADQAGTISRAWDELMGQMEIAQAEADEKAVNDADVALKTDWGADYNKNIELTKRGLDTFSEKLPGFSEFLNLTVGGKKVGDHPVMSKLFHIIGTALGEDFTLPASPGGEEKKERGMNYEGMPSFA